jgi:hypothetical protein
MFTIMPKHNLTTGTQIGNQARIVFDNNAPIDTPVWNNTIDNSRPSSQVLPLTTSQPFIIFNVNWSGVDTGSGIRSYTVYVSRNGAPYTVWLSDATFTSSVFIGQGGSTYNFYSVAKDAAGNTELAKTISDTLTSTPAAIVNSIDDSRFFIRQQYLDFLSREPDPSGWDFWTNTITSCGTDPTCLEVRRINGSAAFFLSIEFQNTGYFVYRVYKAAYGNLAGAPVPLTLNDFLPDTQEIGNQVIVNQDGWQQVLESNKQAFALQFVQRARFVSTFPTTMTPAQFVDQLFTSGGVTPSAAERNLAIAEFGSAANSADAPARSRALRDVADNATLTQQEFNRAFVLMEYFGYLQRNPSDAPDSDYTGYNFWLTKLNQFNGNYISAEMVKAFISSSEYRQRFGP